MKFCSAAVILWSTNVVHKLAHHDCKFFQWKLQLWCEKDNFHWLWSYCNICQNNCNHADLLCSDLLGVLSSFPQANYDGPCKNGYRCKGNHHNWKNKNNSKKKKQVQPYHSWIHSIKLGVLICTYPPVRYFIRPILLVKIPQKWIRPPELNGLRSVVLQLAYSRSDRLVRVDLDFLSALLFRWIAHVITFLCKSFPDQIPVRKRPNLHLKSS